MQPFLPLSWRYQRGTSGTRLFPQALPLSHTQWLTLGDVSATLDLSPLQKHPAHVIRGVHPLFLERLPAGQELLTGREALLDLRHKSHVRRSIRALARRGLRHGEMKTFHLHTEPLPPEWETAYAQLEEEVNTQQQVPLAYMYRRSLYTSDRAWFFVRDKHILGAISAVRSGPCSWHTEVLMRQPGAPVGIMEALVCEIFDTLKSEGERYWSLGEVPFYPTAPPQHEQSRAIVFTGQRIEFAYRARGLLQFKEKFRPLWRPVYLYGYPRLRWRDLASMFWLSRTPLLIATKAWKGQP